MSNKPRKKTPLFQDIGQHPRAALTALASAILPGLGQFLNKQILKGLIWLAVPVLFLTVELLTSTWGRYFDIQAGKTVQERVEQVASTETLFEAAPMASLGDIAGAAPIDGETAEEDMYGTPAEPSVDTNTTMGSLGDIMGGAPAEGSTGTEEDLYGSVGQPGTGDETDIYGTSDTTGAEADPSYFDPQYVYPNYLATEGETQYIIRDFGGFFSHGIWGLFTLGKLTIGQSYAGQEVELFNKVTPWLNADNSVKLMGNGLITLIFILIYIGIWLGGIVDAYTTRKMIESSGKTEGFRAFVFRVWNSLFNYIVSGPALIGVLFFTLIPFIFTFLLAFTNYNYQIRPGLNIIEWVGFETFTLLAMDPGWLVIFGQIFVWTVIWAFMSSFTVYALGFVNALIVESKLIKGRKIWRALLILPWALPQLVILMVFRNVFDKDGLMNQFLWQSGLMEWASNALYTVGLAGKPDTPIFWFSQVYNGNLAKFVTIMVNLWMGAPYHMMVIIGVISTIPMELYESAEVDGATGFQKFRYITMPMVLSSTIPLLIMTFSFNFNNFGAIYFLTGGGPTWPNEQIPESMKIISSVLPGQTDILISWIYKLSFSRGFEQFNVASVYSILIFMIVGGFSVYNMVKSKSFKEEGNE